MARKQAGNPGLPALDSRATWERAPPAQGGARAGLHSSLVSVSNLEAQGHPSPPGSQGPGLLLASFLDWASARNKAETLGLDGSWVACRAGPVSLPFQLSWAHLPWEASASETVLEGIGWVGGQSPCGERWRALSLPGTPEARPSVRNMLAAAAEVSQMG